MKYVVITPAHNEQEHLERTIQSMLAQTIRPLRWVIVNDGSTDDTGEIAERYACREQFIRVITIQRKAIHDFSKKALAFNRGVEEMFGLEYNIIGNLDADITIDSNYFENLVREFERDNRLGITGGVIYTKIGDRFVTEDKTVDSVAGAVQLFRTECFRDVGGGYLPLPYGGIDAAAEIIARMKGWTVRKTSSNIALEYRQTGTATASPLTACYRLGRRFHSLGYGTLFFSLRCLYRISDAPVFVGSCAQFLGYMNALLKRQRVQLPADAVHYLRLEQRKKLSQLFFRSTHTTHPAKLPDRTEVTIHTQE